MPNASKTYPHNKKAVSVIFCSIKAVAFLLIFLLLLSPLSLCLKSDYSARIHEFYSEDKDSLDAVFIGSSNTHAFWSPLYAWKNHGIATFNYSADAQTLLTYRYMIEEVVKYQPNAVIVVTITTPKSMPSREFLHRLTDAMPFSMTKLRLLHDYCERNELSLKDRLEYYLTLYRYHSRWDSLTSSDFNKASSKFPKDPNRTSSYRSKSVDVSPSYHDTDNLVPLREESKVILNDLLDYCEAQHISVLFLKAPQAGYSEESLAELNSLFSLIDSRGFPVLKMQSQIDKIGLDLKYDFYNKEHTNIHGSLKYTDYVADYLIKNYDLSDRRGSSDYQSFENAFAAYLPYTAPYLFPFEDNGSVRDYSLLSPSEIKAEYRKADNTISITWKSTSADADGFVVYRKCSKGSNTWEELAVIDPDVSEFIDHDLTQGYTYYYTVVPFSEDHGARCYGNTDYSGVKVTLPES